MKFLVISLAGIGDTLFATPLIHELRANFPSAQIDALVLWRGARDVLEGNPHLNTVFQRNLLTAGKLQSLKFLQNLRAERYDCSFNTHPQSRIHYRGVARFVGARIRASHRYENFGPLDPLLVNRTLPQNYDRHAIDNNLALLEFAGAKPALAEHDYELFLTPDEKSWAEEFLVANQLTARQCLGIHVGSGGTKNLALRRWPLDRYLALIKRLSEAFPRLAILLFGGPEEENDHAVLSERTDHAKVFVVRSTGLRHAAALVGRCHVFLSVDTALMHVAAAMHVPNQFVIETPTWNKPIEPYRNPFVLIRNPGLKRNHLDYYRYDGRGIQGTREELERCMASVSVDAVYDAVAKAFSAAT